jgi:hypothetical protein
MSVNAMVDQLVPAAEIHLACARPSDLTTLIPTNFFEAPILGFAARTKSEAQVSTHRDLFTVTTLSSTLNNPKAEVEQYPKSSSRG